MMMHEAIENKIWETFFSGGIKTDTIFKPNNEHPIIKTTPFILTMPEIGSVNSQLAPFQAIPLIIMATINNGQAIKFKILREVLCNASTINNLLSVHCDGFILN